jgi:hypothetical protein
MNTEPSVGQNTSLRTAITYKATHPNVKGIYIGCRLDSLNNYYTSSQCFDTAISETGIKPTLTAIDTLLLDWSDESNWQIPYQREREVYDLLKEMGATLLNVIRPSGNNAYVLRKGIKLSNETRKKIAQSLTGQTLSEVTRNKLSVANKGRKRSDDAKANIRAAINRPETRERLSKARKQLFWWNNGKESIRGALCPDGYVSGRVGGWKHEKKEDQQ